LKCCGGLAATSEQNKSRSAPVRDAGGRSRPGRPSSEMTLSVSADFRGMFQLTILGLVAPVRNLKNASRNFDP
jgi:hypothetical protein